MIRKSTQQFSSIENLEDLLTCSIHLGIIDNPRQLQCGHTFCMSCLEIYISHSTEPNSKHICCPLCRDYTELDHRGLSHLAPSYIHKQLTEYLFVKKQRAKDLSTELTDLSLSNNNHIIRNKIKLVNELLNDINTTDISLSDLSPESNNTFIWNLQSVLDRQEIRKPPNKPRNRSKSVLVSTKTEPIDGFFDIKFQSFDQNFILKNMRKYREYTLEKYFSLQMDNHLISMACVNYSSAAQFINESMDIIYIMKNSPTICIANRYGLNKYSFVVNVSGRSLRPIYVKCHCGMVFVSGAIESDNSSCLVKLTLQGQQENVSPKYTGILGGFCFDFTNNTILITYPSKNQVLLLDESLQIELKVYKFGDLSPMFVALSTKTREIWVSCPDNGEIAVYDETLRNYLHVGTNKINDSTPTHIIETFDHRLLFLDIGRNRLFWIFRWNNCVHVQLLLVMGVVDDLKIRTIEAVADNKILFTDDRNTFLAKPNRSPKEEHQKIKCAIL